jgi:DnaJ-domain-containing protein 1
MFLNELKEGEKELFLELCVHAANANGLFVGEEKDLLKAYCAEMQMQVPSVIEETGEDAIIKKLKKASLKSKKIIVLEIIGLLQADKKVDKKERDFLKRLTAGIGISETNVKNIESLLEEYNDVTNKIFNMILDES